MPIHVGLTEGPNVYGLEEGRVSLYVGHIDHEEPKFQDSYLYLRWFVIEGRKIGTPKSYRLHMGIGDLTEVEITKFEYAKQETTVCFRLQGSEGKLTIPNQDSLVDGRLNYASIDEAVATVYNFFGEGKNDMRPQGRDEYYKK